MRKYGSMIYRRTVLAWMIKETLLPKIISWILLHNFKILKQRTSGNVLSNPSLYQSRKLWITAMTYL